MTPKKSLKNVKPAGTDNSLIMTDSNKRTISAYEEHIAEYINGTPNEVTGDVKKWIDKTLIGLNPSSKILEIGSAFGRDASYIESKGYVVQRTDATLGFVEYLQKLGFNSQKLNILEDDTEETYDLIFADAVLLHFTKSETAIVLDKVFKALNSTGKFSFSLKQGEGDEWSDAKLNAPRYFCYWNQADITKLLLSKGFNNIQCEDAGIGRNNSKWLHIIATKQ